MSTAAQDYIY